MEKRGTEECSKMDGADYGEIDRTREQQGKAVRLRNVLPQRTQQTQRTQRKRNATQHNTHVAQNSAKAAQAQRKRRANKTRQQRKAMNCKSLPTQRKATPA
jgi:hypothetical protein